MYKRKLKITENRVKQIVAETIKRVLREEINVEDDYYEHPEAYLENPASDNDYWGGYDKEEDNEYSWNLFNDKPIAPGVGAYNVGKRAIPQDIDKALDGRKRQDWSERDVNRGRRVMSKWVNGKYDSEDLEDFV